MSLWRPAEVVAVIDLATVLDSPERETRFACLVFDALATASALFQL
jgi:hypothetical protein